MTYETPTPAREHEAKVEIAEDQPALGFASYDELEGFAQNHGFNTNPYKGTGLKVWNNFYKFSRYRDINGLYWRNSHNYDQFKPTITPHYRDDKAIESYDLFLPYANAQNEILKYIGPDFTRVKELEDSLRKDSGYGLETRAIAENLYSLNVDTLATIVAKGEEAKLQMFGKKMWELISAFVEDRRALLQVQPEVAISPLM